MRATLFLSWMPFIPIYILQCKNNRRIHRKITLKPRNCNFWTRLTFGHFWSVAKNALRYECESWKSNLIWFLLQVVPVAFHPFLVKWEDDMWYRCMIYDFKEDSALVSVFFVDYGNTQDCHVSDLRFKWLRFWSFYVFSQN